MVVPFKLSSPWQRVYFSGKLVTFQLNIRRKLLLWGQSNIGKRLPREAVVSQPNCARLWATCSWPCFEPGGWIRRSPEVPSTFSHSAILSGHNNEVGVPYLFGAYNFLNILLTTYSQTKKKKPSLVQKEIIILVLSLSGMNSLPATPMLFQYHLLYQITTQVFVKIQFNPSVQRLWHNA